MNGFLKTSLILFITVIACFGQTKITTDIKFTTMTGDSYSLFSLLDRGIYVYIMTEVSA